MEAIFTGPLAAAVLGIFAGNHISLSVRNQFTAAPADGDAFVILPYTGR